MTTEQLTKMTIDQGERIAKLESNEQEIFNRIESLENSDKEHGRIIESIQDIALSTKEMAVRLNNVDDRLELIEQSGRQKNFAVWQIAASAIIGGIITFAMTMIIGG